MHATTTGLSLIEKKEKPSLYLTIGLPVVGKTFVALGLAEALQIPRISYGQLVETALGGLNLDDCPGIEERFPDWACDLLGYHLVQGRSVILDAACLQRGFRKQILQVAQGLGCPAYGLWVHCSPATQKQRLLKRKLNPELIQQLNNCFEPPLLSEGFELITRFPGEPQTLRTDPLSGQLFSTFEENVV